MTRRSGRGAGGRESSPRVHLRLQGGLGNQLFEYAFLLWLREHEGMAPRFFDPGSDDTPGPSTRARQIDRLVPGLMVLQGWRAKLIHKLSLSRKWQRLAAPLGLFPMVREEDLAEAKGGDLDLASPLLDSVKPGTVFSGYFQSRNLADHAIPFLRPFVSELLQIRLDGILARMGCVSLADLASTPVLHVRRGDYQGIEDFHLLGPDFYLEGLASLSQLTTRWHFPKVLITTDSPGALEPEFRSLAGDVRILDVPDPLDVLLLFAQCPLKVISNSTLSYWGARLGEPTARVVYPRIWRKSKPTGDALCDGLDWIGVKNA